MKEKLTESILGIFFAVIGIIVITVGIIIGKSLSDFKKVAVETTATVLNTNKHKDSDGDISYTVYVSYYVDGKEYEGSYKTASYVKEGNNVKIYYDKNNPEDMRNINSILPAIIVCGFGAVFSTVGFCIIISKVLKKNKKERLLQNGVKIEVNYQETIQNYNYSVNGRNPYIIVCQGTYQGEYRTFESENIWNNPEYEIKEKNITTFPVYIDPDNPKDYYLSIEEIADIDKY